MARKLSQKAKLATIAWFLIKFNLLAIPMYIVIYLGLTFPPLQSSVAYISAPLLNIFGYDVELDNELITAPPIVTQNTLTIPQFSISWDSTGWKSMYAIFALAIATPLTLHRRLKFIAIAVPAIFFINILRVSTTIAASLSFGLETFDVVHTFLWREGLILAVVSIWGYWLWREKNNIIQDKGIFRWVVGKH